MSTPTRTLDSLLEDSTAPLGQLTLVDAIGDGVTNDTAAIQAIIDAAGIYGVVRIPAGKYNVPGNITLASKGQLVTGEPPTAADGGGFTLEADGVIFVGGGKLIIDSSKRLTIIGLDAPTHDLCIRGCYNSDFYRCRFRRRVFQDAPGTYFSSVYWNSFWACIFQTTIMEAAATFPVNALFDYGCSHRGSANQGFTTTAAYAIELNAAQNAQNWIMVGGDFSYHTTDILSIGAGNTVNDIELAFIGVYFDSDFITPVNRPRTRITTDNCHMAGKFASGVVLRAAARAKQDVWENTSTAGWESFGGFNFIPNGDFAKDDAVLTGAGKPVTVANTAAVVAKTGEGLMGKYVTITQALTTTNQVTFRSSPVPFTGKYTGQLMLRLAGGTGTDRVFNVGVNGNFSDVVVGAEWVYFSLGSNTERTAGVALDILLRTQDSLGFAVDVCYAGVVFGTNPPLFLPQWTPNFKQDDAQASRFRPGTLTTTRPVWTSSTGSPAGVVVGPRGSLYLQENSNLSDGLWVKQLNPGGSADSTGWYPVSPRLTVATPPDLLGSDVAGVSVGTEVFVISIGRPVWRKTGGWNYADGTTAPTV